MADDSAMNEVYRKLKAQGKTKTIKKLLELDTAQEKKRREVMSDVKRPSPSLVGTGTANYAAKMAELRRKQKEAAAAGDWDRVDAIEAQIRDLDAKKSAGVE